MAKWMTKLFDKKDNKKKINSSDKNVSHKVASDYYNDVVPPMNNVNNNNVRDLNFDQLHTKKNPNVTSSYMINLEDNASNQWRVIPKNDLYDNKSFANALKLSDTRALAEIKSNFKIPKPISFEIKIEKLKALLLIFLSIAIVTMSIIFITLFFKNVSRVYIPHPVLTIPMCIFFIMVFLVNLIDFFALKKQVNLYIEKSITGSILLPNFIIKNYKKIHANKIILRWLFNFFYITLGLTAIIIYFISSKKIVFFNESWVVIFPNMVTEAITLAIVIAAIFAIHMSNLVMFKKRKSNILSYYGYEVVNPSELEEYQKKINRICMIITIVFLTVIFFAIAIPILIVKRRKKKS